MNKMRGKYQNLISAGRYEEDNLNYSIVKFKDMIRFKLK